MIDRELTQLMPDYSLEIFTGGLTTYRARLRMDAPTWIGRRPPQSEADFEYIQIPGSRVRYLCCFEWDHDERGFRIRTGGERMS